MKRKSRWVIFVLILIALLAVLGVLLFSRPQQVDLSYDSSPDTLVIYSDLRWYAGAPPPDQSCQGQFFPSLRVWGDGQVFLDTWTAGQSESSYWSGHLSPEQIHSILVNLTSQGFFDGWTPMGPNPAGTELRIGVHLKTRSWEYSTGDLGPQLYTQLIDQIMRQLHPLDQQAETDFRITSLVAEIQSCNLIEEGTPEPPKPTPSAKNNFPYPYPKPMSSAENNFPYPYPKPYPEINTSTPIISLTPTRVP